MLLRQTQQILPAKLYFWLTNTLCYKSKHHRQKAIQ